MSNVLMMNEVLEEGKGVLVERMGVMLGTFQEVADD
jgi:hypothetical protein